MQENIPGLGEGSLHPCPDELTQVLLGKEISEAHKMCGFNAMGCFFVLVSPEESMKWEDTIQDDLIYSRPPTLSHIEP